MKECLKIHQGNNQILNTWILCLKKELTLLKRIFLINLSITFGVKVIKLMDKYTWVKHNNKTMDLQNNFSFKSNRYKLEATTTIKFKLNQNWKTKQQIVFQACIWTQILQKKELQLELVWFMKINKAILSSKQLMMV